MTDERLLSEALPRIADWYAASRRVLPWREEPTPYHVWISEIMLQQTRIEAVLGYYARFLEALPDLPALAAVEEDRLLKLWEGLGYYSRARNLKKAAQLVMERYDGSLPETAAELKKLPGIGDYTAGAIASIAYGQPEPAVDGNVLRVLSRLLASEKDVMEQATRKDMAALLRDQYPSGEAAGLLTEGLMELGETLCIPNGAAKCELCPVRGLCRARQTDSVDQYPVKTAPKKRRIEKRTVLLLHCGGRYAIRRRPEKGLLAGLWEFPGETGKLSEAEIRARLEEQGLQVQSMEPIGSARHVFTHVEWEMEGWRVACAAPTGNYVWETPETIRRDYSLPTALRFYREKLEAAGGD